MANLWHLTLYVFEKVNQTERKNFFTVYIKKYSMIFLFYFSYIFTIDKKYTWMWLYINTCTIQFVHLLILM